jgi:hypothetical protein
MRAKARGLITLKLTSKQIASFFFKEQFNSELFIHYSFLEEKKKVKAIGRLLCFTFYLNNKYE